MDKIIKYLEDEGFVLISQPGYRIQIYVNPKEKLTIKLERDEKKQQ